MLLSNRHSFVLTSRPTAKSARPSSPMLLPNAESFLLHSQPIIETVEVEVESDRAPQKKTLDAIAPQSEVTNEDKRNFLKVAGVAGAGVIASQLVPKKAQALIMGSSPTTGVVGVKDASNTRINPATEETAATLLKTSDLSFDTGDLRVKVTGLPGGVDSSFSDAADAPQSALVDADRHVQVDVLSSALPTAASTESTLQTISFGGFKFSLRLETVGDIDYVGEASIGSATSSAVWRIRKIDNTSGLILEWAGAGAFNQIWDNRASLTYS